MRRNASRLLVCVLALFGCNAATARELPPPEAPTPPPADPEKVARDKAIEEFAEDLAELYDWIKSQSRCEPAPSANSCDKEP